MQVISVMTQKGGVGKTTSTIHIGGALESMGYKVLLIDFDTQMNLSIGYNVKDYSYTVEDFLLGNGTPKFSIRGKNENVFIIAGSSTLNEKKLNKNSLKKAISNLKENFDFVLVDCPPKPINTELSFGEIAVNASNFVISPIRADKYSLAGIGSFLNSINTLKQNGLQTIILGFFFNEVEQNTNHFQNYYSLLSQGATKDYLFLNFIRKDVNIKNAMDDGKTIFEIKPYGRASKDFHDLTKELVNKISKYENHQ